MCATLFLHQIACRIINIISISRRICYVPRYRAVRGRPLTHTLAEPKGHRKIRLRIVVDDACECGIHSRGACASVRGQMTAGKGRSNPGHMCMDLANTGMPEVTVEDHTEVYRGWLKDFISGARIRLKT